MSEQRKIQKVGNKNRSSSHDRAVECQKCGLHFAVSNNSPVDYIPQHECARADKNEHGHCKMEARTLILIYEIFDDILSLALRLRSNFLYLAAFNVVLAAYVIAMLFLLVN